MIDAATIIFIISLLGIVGMLFLKLHEVKTGKQSLISRLGESTDHHVHDAYDAVKYFISHLNRRTAIAAAQWVAVHVLSWLRSIYHRIYRLAHLNPHSKKVIDIVRGKVEVQRNGGSSFFLKEISEDAANGEQMPVEADSAEGMIQTMPEIQMAEQTPHSAGVAETPEK
jgi:hypothetical protein